MIGAVHDKLIRRRRIRVLSLALETLLTTDAHILDVGCGDGELDKRLMKLRPDIQIEGIDVLARKYAQIPVREFDGRRIPYSDNSIDIAMLIDVLHHTEDPTVLLAEAQRVARQAVIIKDHCLDGILAGPTLRLMDWTGNARYEVPLPYNYWPRSRWLETFEAMHLRVESWQSTLRLYPWPANLIFDRSLHFLARLSKSLRLHV